ncbi:uncharacterized protein A4U43_C03F23430 [Asparagus officinalis]|uniref:Uncharacterized protein n=1 Tax=Asparagus officinalis TaxID=4686 RepID=A0A5P1FCG7_ASPOF|nr:uncharacterized protein LOC109834285 [Asparagus officinalis]ONK76058.1 uncharacterized protein A4U43_C03F23430 [Asparagus officinalis]
MAFSSTLSPSSSSILSFSFSSNLRLRPSHHHRLIVTSRVPSPLRAYRKSSNYPQDTVVVVPDPRAWIGDLGEGENNEDDDDEDDEEEEDDRSLDLLARFIENVFRKISRRARKAARSVLPSSISTKLVRFSVNGVLILAFLWILKAFLEVVCAVGTMVFVSILFVRGVWSGISYIRERQYYHYIDRMDNDDRGAWTGAQPAT